MLTAVDLEKVRMAADAAYAEITEKYAGERMSSSVREHFETDVTVLIRTVNDLASRCAALEQSKAELTAILGDTRAELHAIGGVRVIEHEGRGLKVITSAMHDRLCKAKVGTPQGTTPEVLHCALCGYCYPPVSPSEQEGAGR